MVLASREASETFIAREIEALQKRGYPLLVASLDDLPQAKCKSQKTNRKISRRVFEELLAFAPRNAWRVWRLRKKIHALSAMARETGATRLHAQFAWIAADAAKIAAEVWGIPWSCGAHAWDVFTRPRAEIKRRLRGADFVIACNDRARDAVARAAACHVHLVRHGVTKQPAPVTSQEQDVPATIIAIGRLVPKKGFDTLLVAMAKACHDARCVVIGDGPERGRLEALATRLGIASRVRVAGRLPHTDAMRELARATLLALPSRRTRDNDSDGFANVLTEAMARGVPIVSTTAAGAGELLVDGESALLVPPDNPVEFARAMSRLLADDAFQKRLADNARRVLETQLNEEVEIAKTAKLLFGESQYSFLT